MSAINTNYSSFDNLTETFEFNDSVSDFTQKLKNNEWRGKKVKTGEMTDEILVITNFVITHSAIANDTNRNTGMRDLQKTLNVNGIEGEEFKNLQSIVNDCLNGTGIDGKRIAHWINQYEVPVVELNLSLNQIAEIGADITFLDLSGCTEDAKSIQKLIACCPRLEILKCDQCPELRSLSNLPDSIEILILNKCYNLEEITVFPKCLEVFICNRCPKLKLLPEELPQNTTQFYCDGCEELLHLPKLNSKLEALSCSGCLKVKNLPNLPISLKELNINVCESLEKLPDLGKNLESLAISGCKKLVETGEIPKSLKKLICHSCPVLKIKNIPDECEVFGPVRIF